MIDILINFLTYAMAFAMVSAVSHWFQRRREMRRQRELLSKIEELKMLVQKCRLSIEHKQSEVSL